MQSKRGKLAGLKKAAHSTEIYDSLLERNYMLELENNPAIANWTKDHGIKISYYVLGIKRAYLPDFLVTFQDGQQELHETKGAGFLSWLTTHRKRLAGDRWSKSHHMKYRLIENSKGALFGTNMAIENVVRGKKFDTVDDLMDKDGSN